VKAKAIATVVLIAAALAVPAIPAPVGFPILVDLSHKQPLLGLDVIIRMVPEAQWYVLVKTPEDAQAHPPPSRTTRSCWLEISPRSTWRSSAS
jgi:ABC-type anion transport system duplicated permease subunit